MCGGTVFSQRPAYIYKAICMCKWAFFVITLLQIFFMEKNYNHLDSENNIYQLWENSGAFNPDSTIDHFQSQITNPRSQFSIIMPPPNANDPLHVGHAMFLSIEDVLIRYHRMKGDDTVWIPGTDHAGIETQYVFEKKLAKQGKSRFQFDRETLYSMIWDYVQENSGIAVDQMKKLGASADWSRFRFTLDPQVVSFVLETFNKLHKDKLVYRDLRLVNYCTKCGTSYSELEVNHTEQTSPLYYVRYRLVEKPEEYIVLATTRPEPIFVDTHLAVHPDNPKTKHLIGQKVLNPLTDQEMAIIADEFVDPEFGTGIVKLTPAHDFADFEVAKKHNLKILPAIDTFGKIMTNGGKYAGLKVEEARKMVVADLQSKDLIDKIDTTYQNRISTCYRCSRVIEPLPLPQFFIKVKPLVQKTLEVLDRKETVIHGAGREKILRHWLENLKDWNISRQIVWGIRLPVWYSVRENPDLHVTFLDKNKTRQTGLIKNLLEEFSFEEIEKGLQQLVAPATAPFIISSENPSLKGNNHQSTTNNYLQETDTFDTWFSSGQWPVVTLTQNHDEIERQASVISDQKAPTTSQKTHSDFQRFYPTSVMETGYDILPFWVMRMMLLGIYLTGQTPFKDVYLHGLVRDEKGQKMSKSKGNVINPLDLVEKYGADALRMALMMSTTPGNDSAVGEQKVKGMRNFSNKIWNASRFVLMQLSNLENTTNQQLTTSEKDGDFSEKLRAIAKEVSQQLEDLKIGQATETVYGSFWHWFCDECIEQQKQGLLSLEAITQGLIVFIQLLHPFAPFVTETVWQELRKVDHPFLNKYVRTDTLIASSWPFSFRG